jgi:hypothetical protein
MIPFGGTGIKPSVVIETFSSAGCLNTLGKYYFPNGLGFGEITPFRVETFSSSPGFGDVFIESGLMSVSGSLNLGDAIISGSPVTTLLTITNTSPFNYTSMSMIFTGSGFSFSGGYPGGTGANCSTTLNAGASCKVLVTFSASTVGNANSDLTINFNNGSTTSFTKGLTANGVAPAQLTISPSGNQDFGYIMTGLSVTKNFIVTNTGNTNATSINSSNSTSSNFIITHTCGSTLSPSHTCNISATFSPVSTGPAYHNFTLNYSNGVSTQSTILALSGGGSLPTFKTIPQGLSGFDELPSNVVKDVIKKNNILYVATDSGLAISDDNGSTFITKTTKDGLPTNELHGML